MILNLNNLIFLQNNTYLHNTAGKDRLVVRSTAEQPLLGKNSREKTLNLLYTATLRQPTTVEPTKLEDKVDEEEEISSNDPRVSNKKNGFDNESKQPVNQKKLPEHNDLSHSVHRSDFHSNRDIEDYHEDSDENNEPNVFSKQPIAQNRQQNLSDNEDQVKEQRYPKFEKSEGYSHNNNAYLNSDSD